MKLNFSDFIIKRREKKMKLPRKLIIKNSLTYSRTVNKYLLVIELIRKNR